MLDTVVDMLSRAPFNVTVLEESKLEESKTGDEDIRFRIDEEVEDINERFNDDLERYENGELDEKYRFELGMPSRYLLSASFPELPISMRQSLLKKKSQQPNHPFDPEDIKNMVEAIQKPLAIFTYSKDNVRNLLVSLERDGKHFLVGITLGFKRDGLEINSISGLFPKQNHEWIKWIQNGMAVRIDQKEKVLQLIDSLRINPAEAKRIGLDLDETAKIVKDFENPKLPEEKVLNRQGDGVFTDDENSLINDPWSKAWVKTLHHKKQRKAYAERQRNAMREKERSLTEPYGIEVEISNEKR